MLEQRNKLSLSKISAKIQARAKQWTAHLEATLKLQMQRSIDKADHGLTSLEKKLLVSIVSDTLLQLKQLMLALRGLPCVCQSLYRCSEYNKFSGVLNMGVNKLCSY